jgi:hypothetical protein
LEERVFNKTEELHAQLREEARGDPELMYTLFRDYNANRVAYFVVKGWEESPIEVMANGDMKDGQHRWLAAHYLERDEVDVIVF